MNVYFIPQALLTAAFLRAVLLGFAVGGAYDLARAPRRAFRAGPGLTAALDAAFVLALLGLCFWFFVVWAYGLPRAFAACGVALGAALYFWTLSPLVLLLLVAALSLLTKIFTTFARIFGKISAAAARIARGIGRRIVPREKIQKNSKFLFHFRTK